VTFTESMDRVAQLFEAIGALVLLAGLLLSVGLAIRSLRRSGDARWPIGFCGSPSAASSCSGWRSSSPPTWSAPSRWHRPWENVAILGAIVLIRTVLSLSLEVEIEGVAPWRRAAMSGAGQITRAAERSSQRADSNAAQGTRGEPSTPRPT
jgi:hypothetical protein